MYDSKDNLPVVVEENKMLLYQHTDHTRFMLTERDSNDLFATADLYDQALISYKEPPGLEPTNSKHSFTSKLASTRLENSLPLNPIRKQPNPAVLARIGGKVGETLVSTSASVISASFRGSENYSSLEMTDKTIEATASVVNRIRQIVDSSRRRLVQLQSKMGSKSTIATVTSKAVSSVAVTTATSASGAGTVMAVVSVTAVALLMMMVILLMVIITVASAASLVTAYSNQMYWPLENNRYISSHFGEREVLMINGTETRPFHTGVDIPAPESTPIGAASSGTVSFTAMMDYGYGYHLQIVHENGYETRYAHMSEIYVSPGQYVYATEIIGTVGSTGTSSGNHLHFELWYLGSQIDPLSIEYLEWGMVLFD
ncbi:MAG: M23 family metallopeptidase [Oscillospiraceae bacterium]|nr:M23 family metallopeptidase [Oscillospiraceae bacterium]